MLWRLFKKRLPYEIVVLIFFIICYIICRTFNITCLFYAFTKIPCPTCYMGRALIALLKGDINRYITYNIMALPVTFVFLVELFNTYFGKYKSIVHIGSLIVLAINIIYYLIRMIFIF